MAMAVRGDIEIIIEGFEKKPTDLFNPSQGVAKVYTATGRLVAQQPLIDQKTKINLGRGAYFVAYSCVSPASPCKRFNKFSILICFLFVF